MDELTICDFPDTNFLNMESSVHYIVSNPCSRSIMASDLITHTNYYPSTISLPPPPPLPTKQPWPYLQKGGDSSTKPDKSTYVSKVVTPYIPVQDQRSKDNKPDHRHQQASSSSLSIRKRHYTSERRRRNKIKEKMKILKDLIPNCEKKDMVSVLDEAIKYIQELKFQAQLYNGYHHQLLHAQQGSWRAMGNLQLSQMMIPAAVGSAASSSVLTHGMGYPSDQVLQAPMSTSMLRAPQPTAHHLQTITTKSASSTITTTDDPYGN